MPRAEPIVKKGVYNRRENITIDGLTATRGHHQMLKRQRMNKKFADKARAKRQTTANKATQNIGGNDKNPQQTQPNYGENGPADNTAPEMYYDYKHGRMRKLRGDGTQAAWVGVVGKASEGRTRAKKGDLKENGKRYNIRDQTLVTEKDEPQYGDEEMSS